VLTVALVVVESVYGTVHQSPCLFLLLISQVVQAVDHEGLPCTTRDPSCAQFSCVLETDTLALFVSIDCV
jgi:hypothetical protein